jgi:hypothetical protein
MKPKTQQAHTPTPWEFNKVAEGRFAIGAAYRDENDMPMEGFIADVPLEANAAIIKHRVNTYEALVTLLEEAKQYVAEVSSSDEDDDLLNRIDAALKGNFVQTKK